MSGRDIQIHIRISRRALIVLGVVLALLAGGVVFAAAGTRDASAAATGNALCVRTNGTVVQRTACLTGERTLAAGKYETAPLAARRLRNGTTTMPLPRTAAGPQTREGEEPDEVVLYATELFQSTLYAFTARYEVPANWRGTINGACPDYAPMYVANAMYSPEWQAIFDTHPEVHWMGAPLSFTEYKARFSRTVGLLNDLVAMAEAWNLPLSPADPFTLYVTQICGSIVALTPTG